MFLHVELEGPGPQDLLHGFFLGAPENGFDAGHEFPGAEGFGDVIICAELETDDLVGFRAFGGKHDDGHRVGPVVPFEGFTDLKAAHFREHEIKDHKRRSFFERHLKSGIALGSGEDAKIFLLEIVFHKLKDVLLVFDEEDRLVCHKVLIGGILPRETKDAEALSAISVFFTRPLHAGPFVEGRVLFCPTDFLQSFTSLLHGPQEGITFFG